MREGTTSIFDIIFHLKPQLRIRRGVRLRMRPKSSKASKLQYVLHKESARVLVKERIEHFSQFYNFTYKSISIKNVKSRWGSCSKEGNLNFNYKISFLPAELQDYIIVHELCHLGELNHSLKFWNLVSLTLTDYKTRRRTLRKINMSLVVYNYQ